jgi:hypothetical protein
MRARHLTIAGVLLVAACSAPAAPAPGAELRAELSAAADRTTARPAAFAITANSARVTGTADPATGRWEIVGDGYTVRRIGSDLYVRVSGKALERVPAGTNRWIKTPVPYGGENALAYQPDFPWTPLLRLFAATDLTRTGDRSYRGVLPWNPTGAAARCLFTAGLDGDGRLTDLAVTVGPGSPDGFPITFAWSGFGRPAPIAVPPPAGVVEEPAFTTALLGSPFL